MFCKLTSTSLSKQHSIETSGPLPGKGLGGCLQEDDGASGQLYTELLLLLRVVICHSQGTTQMEHTLGVGWALLELAFILVVL